MMVSHPQIRALANNGIVDHFFAVDTKSQQIDERIEVLQTIEFSSKRKRMSVIIRDVDNHIRLFTKGADTVMFERLASATVLAGTNGVHTFNDNEEEIAIVQATKEHIRQFSTEGLRCLVIASAVLDESVYQRWNERYAAARADLAEIDKRKAGIDNEIERLEDEIERGLHVLGATALEDKLQQGVPQCIANLAKAGLNIWVLTGQVPLRNYNEVAI